jgi:hypothetical protein
MNEVDDSRLNGENTLTTNSPPHPLDVRDYDNAPEYVSEPGNTRARLKQQAPLILALIVLAAATVAV